MRITLFDALRLDPKFEPCRQERRPSLLPASPLPRLQVRGDFPHTKRSVPDSPMLRTPPAHREEPLTQSWAPGKSDSWFRNSRLPPPRVVAPSNGTQKMKADRWERSAFSNSSAWESGRSLGCVGRGFNERLGNRRRTLGYAVHSMRDVVGKVQWRISALTTAANF
jgi:hypothetical protein